MLHTNIWQTYKWEISLAGCTCVNKGTAEINHEPEEERVGVMNII